METERHIHTVRELNDRISDAVKAAFPQTVWVKGEVQRLPADAARRTHVYFELHETGASGAAEYQIPVGIMGWDRRAFGLGRFMDGSDPDLQLANKLEVCFEAQVDFFAKFGKLSLKIVGVDKSFALGRLEVRRREVLAHLEKEGLLELNKQVPLPVLPLKVGLITSPGSAAEKDFTTGLEQSPWAFTMDLAGARMQGEHLQAEVLAALDSLMLKDVDVIVLTRGGGSRADLSWFDQQELAVAIARCPVPVVTAIGHEIDTSIADLVAHHRCKTPTAAAEFLVDRVDLAAGRVADAGQRLEAAAVEVLTVAEGRLEAGREIGSLVERRLLEEKLGVQRGGARLQQSVGRRVTRARALLGGRTAGLASAATRRLVEGRAENDRAALRLGAAAASRTRSAAGELDRESSRLTREVPGVLRRMETRLATLGKQAELQDPARLLARGYSITKGSDGRALVRAADAAAGSTITTLLAEGELRSVVQPGAGTGGPERKAKKRGTEEDPGQETLFR